MHLSLSLAAIRLELRVPPPRDIPRSGALVIDFHDVELRDGLRKVDNRPRFATLLDEPPTSMPADSQPIFKVECKRILVAHSLVGQSLATTLLSIGALSDGDGSESADHHAPLQPRISVIKSQASSGVITALNVEVPSAHIVVSKEMLDGLQYFIDDASQLFERFSQRTTEAGVEGRESADTSLIGSRFFAKSRSNSGSALMSSASSGGSETVVKVAISEGTTSKEYLSPLLISGYSISSSMGAENRYRADIRSTFRRLCLRVECAYGTQTRGKGLCAVSLRLPLFMRHV